MDVLKQVEAVQISERISNERVGQMIGCSSATWSLIRKGKYAGNVDRYLARARDWLKARSERREPEASAFVETEFARRVLKACRYAADMGDCCLILAPSGAGKTAALREFARRRGDQAVYLQAGEAAATKLGILRQLAAALGAKVRGSSTLDNLAAEVRERLARAYNGGVGSPKVLLVDEAQTLQPKALNLLRNFHDDPGCRAVLILADTWRLHAELRSIHGIVGGYEQLRSRFGVVVPQEERDVVRAEDVDALATAVVRSQGFGGRLPAAGLRLLAQAAGQPGRLRNVVKRLRACYRIAEAAGREAEYTPHELDYAAQVMGLPAQLDQKAPPWAKRTETYFGGGGEPAAPAAEQAAG